ncbi:MAG: lysophospholipid acyltransferase family protein [Methylotenera sp.]|uniref:lysophospholipid acyltransferase family protein n=1 Tax=Methylotenera sp. TaxID=2051956 RepID=UPI0024893265|nr:lysophospholipid acyltransferase family protein [Methylotenera sp.]MDI1310205.1 lysophospholipid acyltransferase family protein [Methylotenera sp.]
MISFASAFRIKYDVLISTKNNAINTPTHTSSRTSRLTRYFRISRIFLHTLLGIALAALVFPLSGKLFKLRLIKWWCKHLLGILNIRLESHGHLPPPYQTARNIMFVGNHISWIDIHVLNSIIPTRFIAKSDIKSWPVFGYLAKKSNVLFISRVKRQDAARIVHATNNSLLNGDTVCLFPEGTTTDGTEIKPFKSSIIQGAIHANAVIWPIAFRYPLKNGSVNTEIAYAGETTLIESIQLVLQQKKISVELHFLPPIATSDLTEIEKDRRKLTSHIEQLIKEKLKL